jgi:2-oxoglutarate ferredoxin oxidoreductase subunit beta
VNNEIYGMTGGQFSPTTPTGSRAATAPYGNIDPGFDLCNLTIAAGATYVARGHVGNGVFLERLIKGALQHKGFSVIEVMSNCHTQYGRRNKHPDPSEFVDVHCVERRRAFEVEQTDGRGEGRKVPDRRAAQGGESS